MCVSKEVCERGLGIAGRGYDTVRYQDRSRKTKMSRIWRPVQTKGDMKAVSQDQCLRDFGQIAMRKAHVVWGDAAESETDV